MFELLPAALWPVPAAQRSPGSEQPTPSYAGSLCVALRAAQPGHSACMPTRGQRKHPQEPRKRPPRPQDTTQADGRTLVCYVSAIALIVFLATKLALGL